MCPRVLDELPWNLSARSPHVDYKIIKVLNCLQNMTPREESRHACYPETSDALEAALSSFFIALWLSSVL